MSGCKTCQSLCLYIFTLYVCQSVILFVCLSVILFVCLSVCLSVSLSCSNTFKSLSKVSKCQNVFYLFVVPPPSSSPSSNPIFSGKLNKNIKYNNIKNIKNQLNLIQLFKKRFSKVRRIHFELIDLYIYSMNIKNNTKKTIF